MIDPYYSIDWLGRDPPADRDILRVSGSLFTRIKIVAAGLMGTPEGQPIDFVGFDALIAVIAHMRPEDMRELYEHVKAVNCDKQGLIEMTRLDDLTK